MIKKMICLLLVLVWLLTLVGCSSKTVICDNCGAEIQVKASADVTDEWIVYCSKCEMELFGEDGLVPAE